MGLTRWRVRVIVLLIGAAVACDEASSPNAPSAQPVAVGLQGVVTSSVTGAPIAGATVRLLDGPKEGVIAVTSAAGAYLFPGIPSGSVNVAAHAEGYLELRTGVQVDGAATLNLALQPVAYAPLAGAVRDERGAPLRALVSIESGPSRGLSVICEPDGSYRFPLVQVGETVVRASLVRYQATNALVEVNGTNRLEFVLRPVPKVSLTGTVRESGSGQPIAGATVRILDGFEAGRSTTTNATGAYRFDDLTPGGVNLSATASGYAERRAGVAVNGTNTLDFQLSRTP